MMTLHVELLNTGQGDAQYEHLWHIRQYFTLSGEDTAVEKSLETPLQLEYLICLECCMVIPSAVFAVLVVP